MLVRSAVEAMEKRGNLRMEVEGRAHLAGFLLRADERLGALTEARRAIAQSPERSPSQALALASLARILTAEHAYGAALEAAEQARSVMSALGGIDEGEALIRLVYAESLYGTGQRAQARLAVAEAHERLRKRAGLIDRPDWRRSFLTRVPDNARTVELYQRWH